MQTWHIHIEGQVQGVGFRPYVFLLAKEYGLNGWVNNTVDGVHIEINAVEKIATDFYKAVVKNSPNLARITRHQIAVIRQKLFDSFKIIHSATNGQAKLLLTPDFSVCSACLSEVHDSTNPRANYPFLTCTNCGPRYSIIQSLPYDRVTTTMDTFQMCPNCKQEYTNPLDRRYYSQTNSCQACGINIALFDANNKELHLNQTQILDVIISYWKAGKIVAIKGIGGYLLTCDAANIATIKTLRERKYRPTKPFAAMFPSVDTLQEVVRLRAVEMKELTNPIAPIVLLDLKEATVNNTFKTPPNLAPNVQQIGVMLPSTPLLDLLVKKFGKAIIATSGNRSNAPIIFEDNKAVEKLSAIADYIVTNNRTIVIPQDDSLVKFTTFQQKKIIIRRSRGLAPTYINPTLKLSNKTILATGAMLKSTFSLLHQGNTYISQYLGDLASFETQESYQQTVQHFLKLFKTQPAIILTDKHPDYPSSLFGQQLASSLHCPIKSIQHHIAHFGAVLGENDLLHTQEPILGVIWDGTGVGNDQQIWGGEFFKYEKYDFLRCSHFDYFDFILGDKMPKEPRIAALSACWGVMGMETILKEKFTKIEWQVYSKLLTKESPLQTSSVGRIFDAVASLLGILDKQSYEGEAAMQLEAMALQYFKKNGLDFPSSYFLEGLPHNRISTKSLMTAIIIDLQTGKSKAFIAAKFHYSLIKLVKTVANNLNITNISFSGGVFQNGVLVDLLLHHLSTEFNLYFHQQLSPNDENISFGQLVCYQIQALKNNW